MLAVMSCQDVLDGSASTPKNQKFLHHDFEDHYDEAKKAALLQEGFLCVYGL